MNNGKLIIVGNFTPKGYKSNSIYDEKGIPPCLTAEGHTPLIVVREIVKVSNINSNEKQD